MTTPDEKFDPDAAAPEGGGLFGLTHRPEEAGVIIVPVPFDATTSYRKGAADGPRAILGASAQVELFDLDTGRPYTSGIAMVPEPAEVRAWNEEASALAQPIIDRGGRGDHREALGRIDELCERMNHHVYTTVRDWLAKDRLVGVVGGDHSVPYGAIRAHLERHPRMGVLHVDAHADLRDAYEGFTWSHASIMFNVMERLPLDRLVQVGVRDLGEREYQYIQDSGGRIHTFFDSRLSRARLDGMPWREQVDSIVAELPREVYVSFDIDGLDPALCSHTGTPVPGGLTFAQAVSLLEGLIRNDKRIVGFDLNEVAPGPDGDEWDGNVGARLLYKLVGHALLSRRRAAP